MYRAAPSARPPLLAAPPPPPPPPLLAAPLLPAWFAAPRSARGGDSGASHHRHSHAPAPPAAAAAGTAASAQHSHASASAGAGGRRLRRRSILGGAPVASAAAASGDPWTHTPRHAVSAAPACGRVALRGRGGAGVSGRGAWRGAGAAGAVRRRARSPRAPRRLDPGRAPGVVVRAPRPHWGRAGPCGWPCGVGQAPTHSVINRWAGGVPQARSVRFYGPAASDRAAGVPAGAVARGRALGFAGWLFLGRGDVESYTIELPTFPRVPPAGRRGAHGLRARSRRAPGTRCPARGQAAPSSRPTRLTTSAPAPRGRTHPPTEPVPRLTPDIAPAGAGAAARQRGGGGQRARPVEGCEAGAAGATEIITRGCF
jgi:hypothetical protein